MKLKPALRRHNVIEYLAQGYTQTEIAEKLEVHRNTIGRDLDAIGRLFHKDFERGPMRQLVKFMALTDSALQRLLKLEDIADTVDEKRRILKDIREAGEQQIKIMQSLGMIKEAPKIIKVSVQDKIVDKLLDGITED